MSLPSRESLWDVRTDLVPDTIPLETYHGLLFFSSCFYTPYLLYIWPQLESCKPDWCIFTCRGHCKTCESFPTILCSCFRLMVVMQYATFAWGTAIQLPEGFVACVLTTSEEK